MRINESTGADALAKIPRESEIRGGSPIDALAAEIEWMSKLEYSGSGSNGCRIHFAAICLQQGRLWIHRTHPIRPPPYRIQLPGGWPEGGCHLRVDALIERYPRFNLEAYTGWVLWKERHRRMIWEHTWCVTRSGLMVDPSTATCGVRKGWVYMGMPAEVWEEM